MGSLWSTDNRGKVNPGICGKTHLSLARGLGRLTPVHLQIRQHVAYICQDLLLQSILSLTRKFFIVLA